MATRDALVDFSAYLPDLLRSHRVGPVGLCLASGRCPLPLRRERSRCKKQNSDNWLPWVYQVTKGLSVLRPI